MLESKEITNHEPALYATRADFCRLFEKDMNRLYLLSFLLTANHSIAEKCFVQGLEDSAKGNSVFKEWAESWARRTIIQNAIRMIHPRQTESSISSFPTSGTADHHLTDPAEIVEIVELPTFDRFAFVMSVLERYSDRECSLLLDCPRADVVAARIRAMQKIGKSAERYGNLNIVGPSVEAPNDWNSPLTEEQNASACLSALFPRRYLG